MCFRICGWIKDHIDPNAVPVVHPPRRVPFAIRDNFKSELEGMEQADIITKVTLSTKWVKMRLSWSAIFKKGITLCVSSTIFCRSSLVPNSPRNQTYCQGTRFLNYMKSNSKPFCRNRFCLDYLSRHFEYTKLCNRSINVSVTREIQPR